MQSFGTYSTQLFLDAARTSNWGSITGNPVKLYVHHPSCRPDLRADLFSLLQRSVRPLSPLLPRLHHAALYPLRCEREERCGISGQERVARDSGTCKEGAVERRERGEGAVIGVIWYGEPPMLHLHSILPRIAIVFPHLVSIVFILLYDPVTTPSAFASPRPRRDISRPDATSRPSRSFIPRYYPTPHLLLRFLAHPVV